MTMEHLRQAAGTEPFKPFTISLTDGRRFRVPHPEFIWVPPEASRTFIVAKSGENTSIVDLLREHQHRRLVVGYINRLWKRPRGARETPGKDGDVTASSMIVHRELQREV